MKHIQKKQKAFFQTMQFGFTSFAFVFLLGANWNVSNASETVKSNAQNSSSNTTNSNANVGTSSKNIDFEGSLVEGVNKRPWDSVSQVSDLMKNRRKNHLYRIPAHFESENAETRFEMRYQK